MHRHPVFGDIPRIRQVRELPGGRRYEWTECDPDYAPPLPPGAVRGDVRRQTGRGWGHVPHYFYVDQRRRCVQCDEDFAFSAREQKHWYEELAFPFSSVPIRCLRCRREVRAEKALRHRLSEAHSALRHDPEDVDQLLVLAECLARYHEATGEGDLNAGISAARKVRRARPEAVEALFWEARCHRAAGRDAKAAAVFEAFLAAEPDRGRLAPLVDEAEAALR